MIQSGRSLSNEIDVLSKTNLSIFAENASRAGAVIACRAVEWQRRRSDRQAGNLVGAGLVEQIGRDGGHGAFLGADVGGDLDGEGVGLRDGSAAEVCADEGAGEGVPSSDGAHDLDLRGALVLMV